MIERIIYLPTLRCNCRCKHCGQNQWMESECSPQLILDRIMESPNIAFLLSISGGEPFLKEGLAEAVSNLVNNREINVDFTTNGTCLEQVKRLVELTKYKDRLAFSVSIDGLPETHNEIRQNPTAFERAIETVEYLKAENVAVKINIVVQQRNIKELDEFNAYIEKRVPGVKISWIPLISEINGEEDFPYSDNEVSEIYPRFQSVADQAYLETKGKIKLQNCHAGQKSIAIAPDGKAYTCLTGFSYKTLQLREKYMIGDLKSQSMDQVYKVMQSADAKFQNVVRACEGCWNPCEVFHEVDSWGLSIDELKKTVLKKEREQKKRKLKLKKRRQHFIAILLLIFYFCLLNVISHARGPIPYGPTTESPLAVETDFVSFTGEPYTNVKGISFFNTTAPSAATGYSVKIPLSGLEPIGISFQFYCNSQYEGQTLIIDLFNYAEGYDNPEQEQQITLKQGQNDIDVMLQPGANAPDEAELRIFCVGLIEGTAENFLIYPLAPRPKVTGVMYFAVALFSVFTVTAIVWNKLKR